MNASGTRRSGTAVAWTLSETKWQRVGSGGETILVITPNLVICDALHKPPGTHFRTGKESRPNLLESCQIKLKRGGNRFATGPWAAPNGPGRARRKGWHRRRKSGHRRLVFGARGEIFQAPGLCCVLYPIASRFSPIVVMEENPSLACQIFSPLRRYINSSPPALFLFFFSSPSLPFSQLAAAPALPASPFLLD